MSAETGGAAQDPKLEAPAAPARAVPTPGELLTAAREGRGLTVQQVADDLHLDVRLVQAIEANNFALLGPPVYSRGHLRKYATVLGLSPEVVISHYERLSDVPPEPTPIPLSVAAPPPQRVSLRVPLLIVAGVVAGALVLWTASRLIGMFDGPVSPVPQPVLQPVPAVAPPSATSVHPETPDALQPEPATAPTLAATAASTALAPAADSPRPTTANDVTMHLRFTEASWVEAYDAANRRLMYEIGQPGQVRTLTGLPPLRVTVGLASAVSLEINGRSVPVPRRGGRDSTRFALEADGSVR